MAPLLQRTLIEQIQFPGPVNAAPANPGLAGIIVEGSTKVPATGKAVHDPQQAHSVVDDSHSAEALQPLPDMIGRLEACNLYKPREPDESGKA
mmetsp:Transcript_85861/g.237842  ORF Transcript_85861/g.237842 Transcript_85861/m.237842 type:complete len:93 (-) Transcript_85861:710-988(-)